MDATDLTVLVTGASRGIGAAVAEAFGQEGAHVVLCARDADALGTTADAVERAGGTATARAVDVRDEDAVFLLLADAVGDGFDVVIPAAATISGAPGTVPATEETYEAFDEALATNARGVFAVCREAVAFMPPDGRVLVPSGSVAREPEPGMGAYAMSKAAAEGVARGFAADAEQAVGVVDPGLVATELTGGRGRDPADVAGLFVWAATTCPVEELNGGVVTLRDWKRATR
jgi:hypothetical protein